MTALRWDEDLEMCEPKTSVFTDIDLALALIKRVALALEGPDDSPKSGDVFGGMHVE